MKELRLQKEITPSYLKNTKSQDTSPGRELFLFLFIRIVINNRGSVEKKVLFIKKVKYEREKSL
jgi:hypothetical protein